MTQQLQDHVDCAMLRLRRALEETPIYWSDRDRPRVGTTTRLGFDLRRRELTGFELRAVYYRRTLGYVPSFPNPNLVRATVGL